MSAVPVMCADCTIASTTPLWGGYSFNCAACCARLVRSARPLRHAQEALFAAIAMRADRPSKEAIIEQIKKQDRKAAA